MEDHDGGRCGPCSECRSPRASAPPGTKHRNVVPTFTVVTWNPCEWAVVDDHDDMDPVAIFAGPGARERAEEYAAWKNNTAAAAPCPLTIKITIDGTSRTEAVRSALVDLIKTGLSS